MADQFDEMLDKLRTPASWLRILFMLGYLVILWVSAIVVLMLTAAQALFSLFTGGNNPNLRRLGAALADYVSQILLFLSYNTEVRPFPFTPFPKIEESVADAKASEAEDASAPQSKAKAKPRKTMTKPAASRNRSSTRKSPAESEGDPADPDSLTPKQ